MDKEKCLEVLLRVKSQLSEPEQRLFDLSFLEGRSHKAIAKELGISVAASRVRLHRLTEKLRRLVASISI